MNINMTDLEMNAPLSDTHKERQKLFDTYWNYYRGKHKKWIKTKPHQYDDNVTLNFSRRVVNKGVQFLFGKEVTFEIDESDERTAEEEYLDTVWGTSEQKQMLLQAIAINGFVTGTPFVRLYPAEQGVANSLPRIVNLDPSNVDVITHDDDVEMVMAYHIVWKSGKMWKRHIIALDEAGRWFIEEQEKGERDPQFVTVDTVPWAWDFAPVVHCQNQPNPNSVWGISDLEEADINDAINFTASNINRILRFHAHPKTVLTGASPSDVMPTAVDGLWSMTNPEAKVHNLEMQSDLQSSMAYLQSLKNAYSKITGVPELDPEQVNVGALSGFALRILYGDLLEATRIKRNTYGDLLSQINRRLLLMAGKADYDVSNVWQDPLPSSDKEQAETLEIDVRNGVSQETYLERRGYNVEREQERKADEAAAQGNIGSALLAAFDQGA